MGKDLSLLKSQLRVLFVSLFVSLVIMGFKWWAYVISGSIALKTDALESFINIFAIVMAIIAVYQAQRPADSNHPYGHGKIEYFSSAIEGGMLMLGSCYLLYESIKGAFFFHETYELNTALLFSAGSGAMNGLLGAWQLNRGKKLNSEAITTDARHLLADFYTTAGIIVGLLVAKFSGYYFLDSVIAALVSLMLLKSSLKIIQKSALVLSDVEDPKLISKIANLLNSNLKPRDVIDVHMLRSFRSGKKNFVDLHIVVPEFWDVRHAHDYAEKFCAGLQGELDRESEFHPHVEPCMRKYCSNCEAENCPVRQAPFKERAEFTPETIVAASDEDL
jgi:cation diffusion facilitator family transporter